MGRTDGLASATVEGFPKPGWYVMEVDDWEDESRRRIAEYTRAAPKCDLLLVARLLDPVGTQTTHPSSGGVHRRL